MSQSAADACSRRSVPELSELVFVVRAHAPEDELLRMLAHEVIQLGAPARTTGDPFGGAGVRVVVPRVAGLDSAVRPRRLDRVVVVLTEEPDSHAFEVTARLAEAAGAVLHVTRRGVDELRRRGVAADLLTLGYSTYWDRWERDESVVRDTDVLHLDPESPRRLAVLASSASSLWPHRNRIHLPPDDDLARPDRPISEDRWDALRRSTVVLQIAADDRGFPAGLRLIEAVCNGAVVVTDATPTAAELVVGDHFLTASGADLGVSADRLVRDPVLAQEIRLRAYDVVSSARRMSANAERLAAIAEELAAASRARRPRAVDHVVDVCRAEGPRVGRRLRRMADRGRARLGGVPPDVGGQIRLKVDVLEQLERSRRVRTGQLRLSGVDPDEVDEIARTPAYATASPRISVVVPVYNHATEVAATLESAAATDHPSIELIVLDDASTDASVDTVRAWLQGRPTLPALLLAHRVNRGVGRARTELARRARGALVFMLDADNAVYPTALARLEAALADEPSAGFAFSTLEVHENETPMTLISYQPWEPERLRTGNYVDAMALLRRETLLELGGYTEDIRLHGWEDYDLWCRMAEHGVPGVHVPQILGRYRRAPASMLSVTNLDLSDAEALLRERYPRLMARRGRFAPAVATRPHRASARSDEQLPEPAHHRGRREPLG